MPVHATVTQAIALYLADFTSYMSPQSFLFFLFPKPTLAQLLPGTRLMVISPPTAFSIPPGPLPKRRQSDFVLMQTSSHLFPV